VIHLSSPLSISPITMMKLLFTLTVLLAHAVGNSNATGVGCFRGQQQLKKISACKGGDFRCSLCEANNNFQYKTLGSCIRYEVEQDSGDAAADERRRIGFGVAA
jgi:hypothetical protein